MGRRQPSWPPRLLTGHYCNGDYYADYGENCKLRTRPRERTGDHPRVHQAEKQANKNIIVFFIYNYYSINYFNKINIFCLNKKINCYSYTVFHAGM